MANNNDNNRHVSNVINEIINSPVLRREIENVFNSISNTSGTNIVSNSNNNVLNQTSSNGNNIERVRSTRSYQEEIRQLFPSANNCLRRKSLNNKKINISYFKKDVILLTSSNRSRTLKGVEKSKAYEEGYAVSAVNFGKSWSLMNIEDHIKKIFIKKIPPNCELEILVPYSGRLCKPSLPQGKILNGEYMSSIFYQKCVYVRPSIGLNKTETADTDEDELFGEIEKNSSKVPDEIEEISSHTPDKIEVFSKAQDEIEEISSHTPDKIEVYSKARDEIEKISMETPAEIEYMEDDLFDEDIRRAIQNSMNDLEMPSTFKFDILDEATQIHSKSLKDILFELNMKIKENETSVFNIFRDEVYECALRALRRKSFCPWNKIFVKFVDIENTSEGAIDNGGPTREMFRLLLKYLHESKLFNGSLYSKNLSLCSFSLQNRDYFDAGRIIALSLVHGGPGPHFFSKTLYSCITQGLEHSNPNIDDIADLEIKNAIESIRSCENFTQLQDLISNNSIFSIAGCSYVNTFEEKDQIIKETIKFYAIYRIRPALEQFEDGLKTVDIYEHIKKYPVLFQSVMCHEPKPMESKNFEKLFLIDYSENGSNKRITENRIMSYWSDYLIDCEEQEAEASLNEILSFVTGVEDVPPLGFNTSPRIAFLHEDCCPYPKGNTCSLELHLPIVHKDYQNFKKHMDFGIRNGMTFGFA